MSQNGRRVGSRRVVQTHANILANIKVARVVDFLPCRSRTDSA